LDGIVVQFDATGCPEQAEAAPEFCDIFWGVPKKRFGGHTGTAFYEPDFQLFADRFRTFLPRRHSIFWALVTDVLVSLIKRSNLGKSRVGNQGRFARFGDREVFAPCMDPAVCAQKIVCWSLEHPVGTRIAIHLQAARKAFQENPGALAQAFRRVDKGHPLRIFTAPGSVRGRSSRAITGATVAVVGMAAQTGPA
jgi:hypothetical protein